MLLKVLLKVCHEHGTIIFDESYSRFINPSNENSDQFMLNFTSIVHFLLLFAGIWGTHPVATF